MLKCRSIDGLNLLFKAVDVGAEFCGELNLALFGAGRLFESLGGDSCIFGVNMAVVVLTDYLSGEGAVVCAPLVGGLAPLMTDCRDFNSLFGRCELGKGCNELALALCFAGCLLNNAVNGVYGFGFGVVRIAFAGMLCGNFAVIAVPSVLGFAPVMTENRIFNYGSLSGEAVLVLTKLCGVGYFALFFAGRVLGHGGGVHLFGVNMAVVVLTDYLSGKGAVVCAPLVGGLAPLMADCRDIFRLDLFCKCGIRKSSGICYLTLCVAGGVFNNLYGSCFFGFLFSRVESAFAECGAGAVVGAPSIGRIAPVMLFFLFFFLDLNGDVGEYVSYMIGGLCIKVCAYAVIGKNSVSAERLGVSHHIEMHITAGKLDFAFSDSLHDVFVGSDKVVLTAGSFDKFSII